MPKPSSSYTSLNHAQKGHVTTPVSDQRHNKHNKQLTDDSQQRHGLMVLPSRNSKLGVQSLLAPMGRRAIIPSCLLGLSSQGRKKQSLTGLNIDLKSVGIQWFQSRWRNPQVRWFIWTPIQKTSLGACAIYSENTARLGVPQMCFACYLDDFNHLGESVSSRLQSQRGATSSSFCSSSWPFMAYARQKWKEQFVQPWKEHAGFELFWVKMRMSPSFPHSPPWNCHICREKATGVGVPVGFSLLGTYSIHGVFGYLLLRPNSQE